MKTFQLSLAFVLMVSLSSGVSAQCNARFGLVINEIMPANNQTAPDEFGEFDDWVEIYNGTDQEIDLQGYFLSDNHGGNRAKFVFPQYVLPVGGYAIVWCDNQPEQGEWHADFGLSASGEEIGLYDPDTVSVDYMRFGSTPDDIARGRFPNGSGPFKVLIPTFNGPNTNSVDPGVVINEYQSVNESTAQDQWGGFDDWIELYNNSSEAIDLGGWFLSDKIGDPTLFAFPDTVLMPNDYLIVWCDQGLFEPGLHASFKLGSEGDDIIFSNADTITVDYVRFGLITPDETEGRYANGTGPFTCLLPTFSENNGQPDGLGDVHVPTPLSFFPNPAVDKIHLITDGEPLPMVNIYDLAGRMVLSELPSHSSPTIDVSRLAPAVYVVTAGGRKGKLVVR